MKGKELLEATIYADRGYVADLYETVTGTRPLTTITKNESKKAGASLQIFSAELSATETRSYAISSLEMLSEILPHLKEASEIEIEALSSRMASQSGWIEGRLSIFRSASSVQKRDTSDVITTAKDQFFYIAGPGAFKLALITNPSYFSLGLDTFLRMQQTALKSLSIPVRAYVRIFAAETYATPFVAVPLLMLEQRGGI